MLTELLSDLRYRLRMIARRSTVERELDEELRFHLERDAVGYLKAEPFYGSPLDRVIRYQLHLSDAEQVKYRRVQVMNMYPFLDRLEAEVIG